MNFFTETLKMSIYNGKKIVVEQKTESHNSRFNARTVNYTVRIKEKNDKFESGKEADNIKNGGSSDEIANVNHWLRESFQEILDFGTRNSKTALLCRS